MENTYRYPVNWKLCWLKQIDKQADTGSKAYTQCDAYDRILFYLRKNDKSRGPENLHPACPWWPNFVFAIWLLDAHITWQDKEMSVYMIASYMYYEQQQWHTFKRFILMFDSYAENISHLMIPSWKYSFDFSQLIPATRPINSLQNLILLYTVTSSLKWITISPVASSITMTS